MPDDDGDPGLPNYGSSFRESDYAPVPARDLPFGVPPFLGNAAWGRARHPPRRGSVTRPRPDDPHTLVWVAPDTEADHRPSCIAAAAGPGRHHGPRRHGAPHRHRLHMRYTTPPRTRHQHAEEHEIHIMFKPEG